MGEPTTTTDEISATEAAHRLRFRAQLSVAGIATLGAVGLALIAITAGHVDGYRAVYDAGIAVCSCAFMLIIGWGSSSNQGLLARVLGSGFAQVEEIERTTGRAVVVALDDLRDRRERRINSH